MTTLWRCLIWFVPIALFVWVAALALDLDGHTQVVWKPGAMSPFIHGLRPTGRVTLHDGVISLMGDPVYLSVTPPGNYERAMITTTFSASEQPVVELGATVDAKAGQIVLKPLRHRTLDALAWPSLTSGDLTLWQRTPRYDSVEAFLNDPPPLASITTYHASLAEDAALASAWTIGAGASLTQVSLRGFHEFVAATDGRDVELEVEYQDMNRNPGADPVSVRVYQGGRLLAEARRDDDGVEGDVQAALGRQTVRVAVRDVEAGLVKVELNAGNDVYWRAVRSSLPRMAFVRTVTVGDEVGFLPQSRAVTLFTNAQHMTLYTRHAEGVQTVRVGSRTVDIVVPHARYDVENVDGGVVRVDIPRGDLVVETDGMVAFAREAFFDPFPVRLDDRTDLDRRGVDYVLAQYASPVSNASTAEEARLGVVEASAEFELGNLEREGSGALRFVYSLPRVSDRGASVDITRIRVDFERPPRTLADAWRRLIQRLAATL